jgi:hypothetical protein
VDKSLTVCVNAPSVPQDPAVGVHVSEDAGAVLVQLPFATTSPF